MARDFTKYTINNSKALSKRALALGFNKSKNMYFKDYEP